MPTKYIVINGMRHSGRRFAQSYIRRGLAAHVSSEETTVISDSFNAPLKHMIATLLGVTYLETDRYKMRPELNGYSIDMFRDYVMQQMRNEGSEDIFGRCLVHRVLRMNPHPLFVVIDDGNAHDITALTKPIVIRLTRMDKRFTVQEDNFIPKPDFAIENNDHAGMFKNDLNNLVSVIVQEHVNA